MVSFFKSIVVRYTARVIALYDVTLAMHKSRGGDCYKQQRMRIRVYSMC